MISWPEFESQSKRLVGCFGKAAYPQERLEAIYKAVSHLPNEDYLSQVVTNFIADSKTAPMRSDFCIAISGYTIQGQAKKNSCGKCDNGFVLRRGVERQINGVDLELEKAYTCSCDIGSKIAKRHGVTSAAKFDTEKKYRAQEIF